MNEETINPAVDVDHELPAQGDAPASPDSAVQAAALSEPAAPFPALGELFYATCLREEKVNNGYFNTTLVKSRDYEHCIFRCKAFDDTSVIGLPERIGGSSNPTGNVCILRRADFTFTPVGDDVAAVLGLEATA